MINDHLITRMAEEPALLGMGERDLLDLLKVMEEATLPESKVLTWEDTPVREFGVVLAGSLGVYWGAEKRASLGAGAHFGVAELQGDKSWHHTLVTESSARVLITASGQLQNLTDSNPRFAAFFGMAPVNIPVPRAAWVQRPFRSLRPRPLALG